MNAIDYIEENITEDLKINDIAKHTCISPFYFQKGFAMLCGLTVGEYIRKRKLSLAGDDIIMSNKKIIDIALKYGYDSPDSFTKAFTRFHGDTPSKIRKKSSIIKSFAPLNLNNLVKELNTIKYKIVEKEAFSVIGISKNIKYEDAMEEVPKLWKELFNTVKNKFVSGMYGINIDIDMNGSEFEFMIADNDENFKNVPNGFISKTIPKHTWAIFECIGPAKNTLPEVNKKIFTEWLPNCKDYEITEGYNIEAYSDPEDYPKRVQDKNYYCEIWIPIRKIIQINDRNEVR